MSQSAHGQHFVFIDDSTISLSSSSSQHNLPRSPISIEAKEITVLRSEKFSERATVLCHLEMCTQLSPTQANANVVGLGDRMDVCKMFSIFQTFVSNLEGAGTLNYVAFSGENALIPTTPLSTNVCFDEKSSRRSERFGSHSGNILHSMGLAVEASKMTSQYKKSMLACPDSLAYKESGSPLLLLTVAVQNCFTLILQYSALVSISCPAHAINVHAKNIADSLLSEFIAIFDRYDKLEIPSVTTINLFRARAERAFR